MALMCSHRLISSCVMLCWRSLLAFGCVLVEQDDVEASALYFKQAVHFSHNTGKHTMLASALLVS